MTDPTLKRYWSKLSRSRIWFWRPQIYWHGWSTLLPFYRGHDEYNYLTVMLGWTFTGRIIIATNKCKDPGCPHEDTF